MKLLNSSMAAMLSAALLAVAWAAPHGDARAQPMYAPERPIERLKDEDPEARVKWWRGARFGMFIHWGVYSVPGRGEWVQWNEQIPVSEYAKLADQFKPADVDFDSWTEVAKAAGMKYMVMTARHHDGYALFDDGANPFTSVSTGAHRDLVADYVKSVRKAGLGVGLYYSPMDWRFPGYFFPDLQRESAEAMRGQYHRQVEKLLSNYGKIDVLWFDGGETEWLNFGADWKDAGAFPKWVNRPRGQHYRGGFDYQHEKLYKTIRRLQPQVIMNGRADMPEDFRTREGDGALGDFDNQQTWELCTTIAGAWGYQSGAQVRPLKHYIHLLAKVAGRDGNLLLNVGPRADGRIDPPQVERLREIGAWLGKYGESIYETRGGPFLPAEYGASTHNGKTIYVHVLDWRKDKLALPAIPARIVRASVLGGGVAVFTQTAQGIELTVPAAARSDIDTVIALELDTPAGAIGPVRVGD